MRNNINLVMMGIINQHHFWIERVGEEEPGTAPSDLE
jgi:hypothetical protein